MSTWVVLQPWSHKVTLYSHKVTLCLITGGAARLLSSCITLHSHQWCMRVPAAPHPWPTLAVILLILAILGSVKWFWFAFYWWLMMLSIFSCAYWPLIYYLRRAVYSEPLTIFKLGYLPFYDWVLRVLYIFWIQIPFWIHELQICSLTLWVVFALSWWCTSKHKNYNFHKVQFIFSSIVCVLAVMSMNSLPNSWRFIYL